MICVVGACPPIEKRLLSIYLRDHHAASAAGVALARRALGPYHPLAEQIARDRRTLENVMRKLDVGPNGTKVAVVRVAELLGRLKLNGRIFKRSPLSPPASSRAPRSAGGLRLSFDCAHEQEFRQAEEAAEEEAAKNAQGAPQRETRGQEVRSEFVSGRQLGTITPPPSSVVSRMRLEKSVRWWRRRPPADELEAIVVGFFGDRK